MTLKRFRVQHFRSVEDSGWIETDEVTALIGTNESGKTNLLLPLWKLNPAKDGEIKPTADFPRKRYNDFRNAEEKPIFVEAVFEPDEELARKLAEMTGLNECDFAEVQVERDLGGSHGVSFLSAQPVRTMSSDQARASISDALEGIRALTPLKAEQEQSEQIVRRLEGALARLHTDSGVDGELLKSLADELKSESGSPKSAVIPRYNQLRDAIAAFSETVTRPHPDESEKAKSLALRHTPKFVYYSNYGNLDSEIYLPQVIENLRREDLGAKEEAKVRTLKVLFEFVGLEPDEILELGKDFKTTPARQPNDEEISAIAEKKKERSILLQSASTKLTREFRAWWRQGEYRFRFEADGDHFRIWVADDKRPEEIELEGRSTGLQWFLSFYLVFLVESKDAHDGAILLLDEPGISLHPLAQRDLSSFFDGLASSNQLLYTTHSPFLVDADRLDRARKVYVAEDGTTKATPDLRAKEGDLVQKAAGYAVHAALGLTVAESLLLGCTPIIVEGLSDQIYLSTLKTLLIAGGHLKPGRELIFPPGGGAKGVKVVASIVSGRDEVLPIVLFDSDPSGVAVANQLRTGFYCDAKDRVLEVGNFLDGIEKAEIEDLIPVEVMIEVFDRWQRHADRAFAKDYQPSRAIVPQLEAWAARNTIPLVAPVWKVELSKRVKEFMLRNGLSALDDICVQTWLRLFRAFESTSNA